jgi:hypothetical protein
MNNNNIEDVAEKLYYEINPNTTMNIPSFAYELVEEWNKEWIVSKSELTLYDWIKENKSKNE